MSSDSPDRTFSPAVGAVTIEQEPAEQIYDCWTTIGVGGNGTCRELTRFTHCRNCPVYSAAAAQLLDRPIAPEHRREWTDHFAKEKKLTTPARTSVVIFRIGAEWLALPTLAFQEVAERRTVHTLPHRRGGVVRGLVNIRGELLICVSLGRLLGLEESKTQSPKSSAGGAIGAAGAETLLPGPRADLRHATLEYRTDITDPRPALAGARLLVSNWDGNRLVFPVNEVQGVRRVQHDEVRDPPATVAKSALSCTRGVFPWREHTVGLLDADILFATLDRNLAWSRDS